MYDLEPSGVSEAKEETVQTGENKTASEPPAMSKKKHSYTAFFLILALAIGFGLGAASYNDLGALAKQFNITLPNISLPKTVAPSPSPAQSAYTPQTSQEDAVIKVVKDSSPAVVSIIITKDVPVYEQYYISPFRGWNFMIPQQRQRGTEEMRVGAGTGFIVSEDGLAVTNKHVTADTGAEYTAITSDGKKYPAKVMALDPSQDIAVFKIEGDSGQKFPAVKFGDSSSLQIGQTVIAIGNALGEFNNTVSVGVISGLQRSITASGGGTSETLENLIQTDAAINEGNSGGPLLNLKGEVIGVNTAMASGAQNIGFVIPANAAKRDIEQVQKSGKITYAYLGVYYGIVDEIVAKDNDLPVNYGAWVHADAVDSRGSAVSAVVAGSPAASAGLKDGDIILEMNGEKITKSNPLSQLVAKYNPGDKVTLRVRRGGSELNIDIVMGDRGVTQ
jgi:serine protease Do